MFTTDVQAAMNLLLGRADAVQAATSASITAGVEAYVMLALQYARPKNLDIIPSRQDRPVPGEPERGSSDLQGFRRLSAC